jgi:hypothetical protein
MRKSDSARQRRLAGLLVLGLAAVPAAAAEPEASAGDVTVAGVTLPGRVEIRDESLVLNGAALRRIALVKIYVAGLYLAGHNSDPGDIIAADEPRSLRMHFLRDVQAKGLCEGWDHSLEDNTPAPSPDLRRQFEILCGWMEDARDGERLAFNHVPGEEFKQRLLGARTCS